MLFLYNMITRKELKDLIRESLHEIVSEAQATDPNLKALINEFGEISQNLAMEKAKLKELEAKHEGLEEEVRKALEAVENVEDKTLMTEHYIAEIAKVGYSRPNIKYAEAFKLALTKVNAATKAVLEEAKELTSVTTSVPSSIKVKPVKEDHGGLHGDAAIEKAMRDIDSANSVLSKLAGIAKGMSERIFEGGSVPNKPSPFEPKHESKKDVVAKAKTKVTKPVVTPTRKGLFDGKTKAELEKLKTSLQKQNDALTKTGKSIPKENRIKMAQFNSALKIKTNGGKLGSDSRKDNLKEDKVIHSISKPVKDASTGEWVVKWMTNGKRDEDKTYYANDLKDAQDTATEMQKAADKLNRQGGTVKK